MRIGLREANQQFSKAIKAVKAGEEVVLTERGKPIAVITPVAGPETGEAGIRRLEVAGFLLPASKRRLLPPCTPRSMKGPSLAQILRQERDES